jgi:hypothetical protein
MTVAVNAGEPAHLVSPGPNARNVIDPAPPRPVVTVAVSEIEPPSVTEADARAVSVECLSVIAVLSPAAPQALVTAELSESPL